MLFFSSIAQQSKLKDQHVNAVLLQGNYSLQIPLMDYAERYGISSTIGGSLSYKFGKNYMLGFEGNFIFGSKIKDNQLYSGISNDKGQIMGWNGLYEPYIVNQRGFTVLGKFSKVFSFGKLNKNSGIIASLGFGAIQHKIKIDLSESNVPHLDEDYHKGYDQLSNGFLCSQFIGFQFLDVNKRINFVIGWEFNQGLTKHRRSWDFNKNSEPSQALRKDLSTGFRLGWIIPIYLMQTEKYYTH